jgi:hypothetical protein
MEPEPYDQRSNDHFVITLTVEYMINQVETQAIWSMDQNDHYHVT